MWAGGSVAFRAPQTAAAALTAAGVSAWRTTRVHGRPRGIFCGIGACFDCLITVDGRPNQRACQVPARPGMVVAPDGGHPQADAAPGDGTPVVAADVAVVGA